MIPVLPDDIIHLICEQLWHQRDFSTLFNCSITAQRFAAPALSNIYRMHDVAPVTNGGSDEVEVLRLGRQGDSRMQQQQDTVSRWAAMWKTIILSSLGKTLFPYSLYIRALNLRDLKELLEEGKFRGSISSDFFDGDLARFNVEMETPVKKNTRAKRPPRLDTVAVLGAIGEVVTLQSPMLEELSGEILPDALSSWIPRLPRLQHMTLWRGAALSNQAGKLLEAHCPAFRTLRFWEWAGAEADHLLASFLNDLRPQSLEAFEIFSYSDIGAETFLALNCHRGSLQELKLNNIKPEAMPSLSLMKGCVALTSLLMTETIGTTDLENRQHDVFLEVVAWLRKCRGLQSITFQKFMSAPAILTPILLEDNIHLAKLELEGYSGVASREFHLALAHQQSLRSLWLKGDGDDFVRDDFDALIGSLSKLTQLVDLRLRDISDYFRDEHICQLARSLPRLEEWWTSGFGITDAIWTDVASLRSLRRLELSAWTTFTIQGLLEFISTLKDGNRGLILSVMMADPESGLTEDEQSLVRDTLLAKAEGRFDYILARDPDVSEFEGESD